MAFVSNPIEIKWIKTELFVENPWNPNRMSQGNFHKLMREIRNKGFVAPILARPFHGRYQIIDGEHRWKIARELNLPAIPGVITELDDAEARIKTLQLNGLKGENDPDRLAVLLSELAGDYQPEDLARALPWSDFEIEQMIAMTEDQTLNISRQMANTIKLKPPDLELYAVVVTPARREEIERAINSAKQGQGITDDGEALSSVCRKYLETQNAKFINSCS